MTYNETAINLFNILSLCNAADSDQAASWQNAGDASQRDGMYGDINRALVKLVGQPAVDYWCETGEVDTALFNREVPTVDADPDTMPGLNITSNYAEVERAVTEYCDNCGHDATDVHDMGTLDGRYCIRITGRFYECFMDDIDDATCELLSELFLAVCGNARDFDEDELRECSEYRGSELEVWVN